MGLAGFRPHLPHLAPTLYLINLFTVRHVIKRWQLYLLSFTHQLNKKGFTDIGLSRSELRDKYGSPSNFADEVADKYCPDTASDTIRCSILKIVSVTGKTKLPAPSFLHVLNRELPNNTHWCNTPLPIICTLNCIQ